MWSPKGTTWRVIRCPTLQVSQFLFPGQRSDTFLTDHVVVLFSTEMYVVVNVLQVSTGGFLLKKTGVCMYYRYVDTDWSSWSRDEEVCVWLSVYACTVLDFCMYCMGIQALFKVFIPNYYVKYFILCCASIINLVVSVVFFVYAELF